MKFLVAPGKQAAVNVEDCLDFFWQISLKETQFSRQYDQRYSTFFLTGIIIWSFNNNALEKCTNGKAFHIVASAQFFTIFIQECLLVLERCLLVAVTKFQDKFVRLG